MPKRPSSSRRARFSCLSLGAFTVVATLGLVVFPTVPAAAASGAALATSDSTDDDLIVLALAGLITLGSIALLVASGRRKRG